MNGGIHFTVSAPGKVILFGEHSVVYKKAAVSTSISKRLSVSINSLNDEVVLLKLPQIGSEITLNITQLNAAVKDKCPVQPPESSFSIQRPEEIDHAIYIDSLKTQLQCMGMHLSTLPDKTIAAYLGILYVIRGMCNSLSCKLVPFSLEVNSELDVGAGTGSSAAFAVAISASILHYRKCLETSNMNKPIYFTEEVQDNIIIKSNNTNSGFSVNELRVINKWAFCIEKIMHGRPSGIDNTTSTFGSVVVTCQGNSENEGLTFRFLENVPKISILLIATGVARNTANLVVKVRKLREENCAAVDAILGAMDVIAREAFKALEDLGLNYSDPKKGDELYKVLGSLMELNHGLLRTLGVSHESLERIVSVCGHHGLASKLTGAGGGGNAITLVPTQLSKEEINILKHELGEEFKVSEISIADQGVRLELSSLQPRCPVET
ncbi:mevalonate kinase [Macrosteles quadrilineatus]|uniref:mevalonate kinase n=1 Tax=Macrosteles quadrilineatus TaxID=74068 RepID=UPI0023E2F102|nr:mevalonate kinase [Macrosteles quadrilineatus]